MSVTTRSSGASAAALALALALLCGAAAAQSAAPPLPAAVHGEAPGLRVQGGGEMTFFGLSIYEGYYWSGERGFSMERPFALDLVYKRKLDGRRIAERSSDEIATLGFGSADDRRRWGDAMARIFPEVAKGDRLTGLYVPRGGVRFFHNGAPIGEIADPAFAGAFFGIWFDPRTSRADFRRQLLGLAP